MKQLSLFLFYIIFHLSGFAQENKLAIKAGYNYTSARAFYGGIKQSVKAKSGYGIAGMIKMPFEGILHFSPCIGYSKKGFVITPKSGLIKEEDFTIHYFDIAPLLSIDLPIGENSFVISGGPVLSITNLGRQKITDAGNVAVSQKMRFGYGAYGWFDLSFTGSMAYHLKKVFVELGYTAGSANINNNQETDGRNIRNRMISLNIGYYLGKF